MGEELKVSKIQRGTVIDHIRAGMAPAVLKILGIEAGIPDVVVMAMNVHSHKLGRKDVVKIENVILDEGTLQKIAIIAPQATINLIEDYRVVHKHKVSLPKALRGVVRCPNRNCITNAPEERVLPLLVLEREDPVELRCHYCEELNRGDRVELL